MTTKNLQALGCLRAARLLRGVDPHTLTALAELTQRHTLREGETLWRTGDKAQAFTIIQRGLVQIRRRMGAGEPAIIGVFGPTESIGDAAAVEQTSYPAEALCVTEVEVLKLPAVEVCALAAREPSLAQALQHALLDHTRALFAKIDIMSAGSVTARLCKLLLHLYQRFGDERADGVHELSLPLSRSALAHLVSARTETVIRALSALRKRGVLEMSDSGFLIRDMGQLTALARESA